MADIPDNYRIYSADCSIDGRCRVMLVLCGDDYKDWFLLPEVYDQAGNDLRPPLYLSGTAPTIKEAINLALENLNDRPSRT